MINNLHLLRAVAALFVVYFHITSTAGLNLSVDFGACGVDIFFVISGFIISFIGSERSDKFFVRRLIRIVPFYWLATLLVFFAAFVAPKFFRSTSADLGHLFASLLFIPKLNPASGEMMPTLVLGWSLNFEMFFYVVFAGALMFGEKRAPWLAAIFVIVFSVGVRLLGIENQTLLFWSRPIVFEFCFGIFVYYLIKWVSLRKQMLAGKPFVGYCLVFISAILLILLPWLELTQRGLVSRFILSGLPAFALVFSAIAAEAVFGFSVKSRLVFLLGEASYVIYLIHPYIVFGVLRVFVKSKSLTVFGNVGVIVSLLLLTSVISVCIHMYVEKPMLEWLRRKVLVS